MSKNNKITRLLAATAVIGIIGTSAAACSNNDSSNQSKQSSVKKETKDKKSNTENALKKSQIKLSQTEALNKFDEKYSDKEIKEINLKLDGNRYVYEIDGFDKSKEYEMTINARTGKEIKSSSEKLDLDEHLQKGLDLDKTISRKEASEIAEKEVKNSVSIPVIGNGDIVEPEDVKRMIDETGCDAVMIGRGAQGNPWIFERAHHYLTTGELLPAPTYIERLDMLLKHFRLLCHYKGDALGVKEIRTHAGWYMKGLPESAYWRNRVNTIHTPKNFENELQVYRNILLEMGI